jgi:hypothetical protein
LPIVTTGAVLLADAEAASSVAAAPFWSSVAVKLPSPANVNCACPVEITTPFGLGLTLIFEAVGAASFFSLVVSFCEHPPATIAKMATLATADRNPCVTFEFINLINAPLLCRLRRVYYTRNQMKPKEMNRNIPPQYSLRLGNLL